MLQIRLNKGTPAESSGGGKPLPVETVTVACPDHLVLADLPVAKSVGSPTASSVVKLIGRRSRRHLGERVHFCVRCDFPIAIYGRLSPCEHTFCLDCARSDSICYLCDERIQKIQTIKMMEGMFICAAPHCLKSFLKRMEFESHVHAHHSELFQANMEKEMEGNESEGQSFMKPLLRPRPPFPGASSPAPLSVKNFPSSEQSPLVDACPPGFERQQQFDASRGFGWEQGSLLGLASPVVLNLFKETMET